MAFFQEMNHKAEEDARRWITPVREAAIRDSILSAVDEYRNDDSILKHKYSLRTAASIIHDLMVWNIKSRFNGDHDVKCTKLRNLFVLSFGNGDVIMRFKKLDKKLCTRNIPTQQVFEFTHQILARQTSFFDPPINLNAGYRLMGADAKAYITCPLDYKHNSWKWELTIEKGQNTIQMPQPEISAQQRNWIGKEEPGDYEKGQSATN